MQLYELKNILYELENQYREKPKLICGSLTIYLYSILINKQFRNISDIDLFIPSDKTDTKIVLFNTQTQNLRELNLESERKNKKEILVDINYNYFHEFIIPNFPHDCAKIKIDNSNFSIIKIEFILAQKLFKKKAWRDKDLIDIRFILNNIKIDLEYFKEIIKRTQNYDFLLEKYTINEIIELIKKEEIYEIIKEELIKKHPIYYEIEDIKDYEIPCLNYFQNNIELKLIDKSLLEAFIKYYNPKITQKEYSNIKNILNIEKINLNKNRTSIYLMSSILYSKHKDTKIVKNFLNSDRKILFYFKN